MPDNSKLKLMVASTVYNFENQLVQLCGILKVFGYDVWNSHLGTIPVHPNKSNLENCVAAVQNCDIFLGVIRPYYGSGVIENFSITHQEFLEAIKLGKPRWFLVHHDVITARKLLKPYMYKKGVRTKFKLKPNPIIDDLRVIDLYNDAIQNNINPANRTGNWVQEFQGIEEINCYIDSQLKDLDRIKKICAEMNGE